MKVFQALAFGALGFFSVGVHAATTHYSCNGVKGTRGSVTLSLNSRTIKVSGSYRSADTEYKVSTGVDCQATHGKDVKQFSYYNTTAKDSACPADYVRVPVTFASQGEGLLALVDTNGGDDHDWSGYAYQYFYCSQP